MKRHCCCSCVHDINDNEMEFPNAKSLVLFKLNLLKFKSFISSYFISTFYKLEKWIKMRLNF